MRFRCEVPPPALLCSCAHLTVVDHSIGDTPQTHNLDLSRESIRPMNRLCTATRGPENWRERLGSPEKHWRRHHSAFETAVSWELADRSAGGLPAPVFELFARSEVGLPTLLLAIAEHKVAIAGSGADSQCDVWAL